MEIQPTFHCQVILVTETVGTLGTLLATLPGSYQPRVGAWPADRILRLDEIAFFICNICLSMAACKHCQSRAIPEIHTDFISHYYLL